MLKRGYTNDIPSYCTKMKYVSKLNLSSCNLEKFPKCILKLKELELLNIQDNNFNEIPNNLLQVLEERKIEVLFSITFFIYIY